MDAYVDYRLNKSSKALWMCKLSRNIKKCKPIWQEKQESLFAGAYFPLPHDIFTPEPHL